MNIHEIDAVWLALMVAVPLGLLVALALRARSRAARRRGSSQRGDDGMPVWIDAEGGRAGARRDPDTDGGANGGGDGGGGD